ncbi:MAG: ATP-binding cassette domain-containing protein, partial [Verrucomicrobia bacterium]|nr:ATP-binding cassette domain-containing protein [Verrucomicrobiota bacterium]
MQVDNLSLAYNGEFLFDDASFSIQPGERLAFVGRNGAGKSSLFRLLTGKE